MAATRFLFAALGALAALLVAVLWVEYQGRQSEDAALTLSPRRPQPTPPAGAAAVPPDRSRDWAATTLARPLFAPGRRPPAPAATPAAGPAGVARLTAVVITEAGRSAIFAAPDGHPIVAVVGGQVGPWRIEAIGAGEVTVSGPEGRLVMHPSFAPAGGRPQAPGAPAPPAAAKPSILEQLLSGVAPSAAVPGLPAPPAAPR